MVAFSPEIIWRESLSFSCSISMVFQDVFSRVLKGASSNGPSCASIVPRKSTPRQPRVHKGRTPQEEVERKTSDKMRSAGNRYPVRVVDGGGAERYRNGASSLSDSGRCRGKLGIVGRGPGLDAVCVARSRRGAAGSRSNRLLATARVVRDKTSESNLNAFPPRRRRDCSFL